ncbi:MAG: hypothetical protein R3349_04905 [Geminicoccaceae bacterium]|nr:hypothetical protein [Geminicoccaceae bacterium]
MAESQTKAETKAERDLRQDLDTLKNDLDVLKKDISTIAQSLKGAATNRAEQELDQVRQRVSRLAGDLQSQGKEQLRSFEAQIEERPLASLALAFAIGLIFGKMFDRR